MQIQCKIERVSLLRVLKIPCLTYMFDLFTYAYAYLKIDEEYNCDNKSSVCKSFLVETDEIKYISNTVYFTLAN